MLKTTLLFVITAAVFAAIGSQVVRFHTKIPHNGQKCSDDACKVVVFVEDLCAKCDVWVDYELTQTKGNKITWEIDAAAAKRFEFTSQGIVFASGFSCMKDGKKFKCTNQYPTQADVYKYTINLTDTKYGFDPDPLDPWVVNN